MRFQNPDDRWKFVHLMVSGFAAKYPNSWAQFLKGQDLIRQTRANKHASNTSKSMRWAASFPTAAPELDPGKDRYDDFATVLFKQLPELEDNDRWHEFLKTFPVFTIPEKL